MGEVLDLESRRRIYEYVRDHPGAYVREIMLALAMPQGQVTYHLQTLEDRGLVTSSKEAYHKRFYLPGSIPRAQRELATFLKARAPRAVLLALLEDPGLGHGALAERAGISAPTLTYHMKRLELRGLVARAFEGAQVRYRVVDAAAVVDALVTFRRGLLDSAVDRFLDAWLEMHPDHLAAGRTTTSSATGATRGSDSEPADAAARK